MFYIHGTGARDVTEAMHQITERAHKILGWSPEQVVALEWGQAVGPEDLDIRPALPPEYATRGVGEDLSETEQEAALWDLLLADPFAELRLLGVAIGQVDEVLGINTDPASVEVQRRLDGMVLPSPILDRAGLTAEEIKAAANIVRNRQELTDAADRANDPDNAELVLATARALVAQCLALRLPTLNQPRELPRAAIDGHVRQELVSAVAELISAQTKGFAGDVLGRVLGPIATKIAVAKRTDFMGPLSDFVRDIAFYLARGEEVRRFLATEIRRHTETGDPADAGPNIVLAHSLGGIAAVDLLSDPAVMGTPSEPKKDRLKIDLLVTVGSQPSLLYLMGSLRSLRPIPPRGTPFLPWLNLYNREDLLSFCAAQVWADHPQILDKSVSAGVPFPMSHSAYWVTDTTYELIKNHAVMQKVVQS
ncbi:hypothetical protein ARTSIC4J27_2200 [Pseudarthrobacter siccitolerans]|uniref:Uncharacterized protein n=2 Tax=Pseudarthrobacter siccitolerans TaxID=861266 RepID=A0A024H388_9MICC|nr:hypothetical protein ARTSIC4J27_2200 [Pseudarthrobacter siccitolerans]